MTLLNKAKNVVMKKSTTKQDEMKEEAMERWMAYLFLKGSDQTKYGSVMRGFVDQFSLENNQYPKTVAIATDILSNHKLDQRFYDVQKRNRERQKQDNNEPNETSFAQSNSKTMLICYCCGKKGHSATNCTKKSEIPREDWWINKAVSNMMQEGEETMRDDESQQSNSSGYGLRSYSNKNRFRDENEEGWSTFQQETRGVDLCHDDEQKNCVLASEDGRRDPTRYQFRQGFALNT